VDNLPSAAADSPVIARCDARPCGRACPPIQERLFRYKYAVHQIVPRVYTGKVEKTYGATLGARSENAQSATQGLRP
jgi:hypothetical protein